jgi:hypothetical protein
VRGRFALYAVIALTGAATAAMAATAPPARTAGTSTASAQAPLALPVLPPPGPPVLDAPAPGPDTVDYGYDASHDFAAADPSITAPLGSLWSVSLKGDPTQILAADNLIFVLVARPNASNPTGADLLSIDPGTGHANWDLMVPIGSQIAYQNGALGLVGGGRVQGFNANTGINTWNVTLAGADAITPADGEFYVNAAGGSNSAQAIDSINAGSGKVKWSVKPPSPHAAGPLAVDGDRVYRTEATQVQAYNRVMGKLLWHVSSIGVPGSGETATLWRQRLFRPRFTAGSGAPGAGIDGPPLSDGDGSNVNAQAAEIAAGDVGLQKTDQGMIADNLSTGALLWSEYVHPLGALNDQAITWHKDEIELRALASGAVTWGAQITGATGDAIAAVGNGELLVGAGGRVTALLPYANSELPKVTVKVPKAYVTYGSGPAAHVTGSLSQPGIEQSFGFSIAGKPAGSKHFGKAKTSHTRPDGTLSMKEHPQLDTVYRVTLPGSTVALSLFEIVALPQIKYQFGTPTASRGQVKVTVVVPHSIKLADHAVSLYIGRGAGKVYQLLGTGRLKGHGGRFAAGFAFKLAHHVAKKDFVTACFAGLYRQGMSYGDRLDRRCGAATIKF